MTMSVLTVYVIAALRGRLLCYMSIHVTVCDCHAELKGYYYYYYYY